LGFTNRAQPQIASITSPLALGSSLGVNGAQFRGIAEGSTGSTQDSPSDYPLLQLRSLESGQSAFLLAANWSTNSFCSVPVVGISPGYALATLFVNGIQSTSRLVTISVPIPVPTTLNHAAKTTHGLQFAFTNNVGAIFGVLAGTNLAQPSTNWTALGAATEVSPGQFLFTDSQATNVGLRFYQVYSP
jgi:hypothetical protein